MKIGCACYTPMYKKKALVHTVYIDRMASGRDRRQPGGPASPGTLILSIAELWQPSHTAAHTEETFSLTNSRGREVVSMVTLYTARESLALTGIATQASRYKWILNGSVGKKSPAGGEGGGRLRKYSIHTA